MSVSVRCCTRAWVSGKGGGVSQQMVGRGEGPIEGVGSGAREESEQ